MRSLLLLLLLAVPAFAQQPPAKPVAPPPNDAQTQLFRGLFHFHKITPEAVANLGPGYDYANLIVVVHGSPNNPKVAGYCKSVLAAGGAVLVASDTTLSLNTYFPRGGQVGVTGLAVKCFWGENVDQRQTDRPLVGPSDEAGTSPFAGIGRIATDGPSYVEMGVRPPGLGMKAVAMFPDGSSAVVGGREFPFGDLKAFAYATADDAFPAKCMVLADPDVLSNKMIYTSGRAQEQEPTDNLKFADATVRWLKGGWRTKCLFIENGQVQSKFDEFEFASIPLGQDLPPPPIPNIDLMNEDTQKKLANAINTAVNDAQAGDVFNKAFTGTPERKAVFYTILATVLAFIAYGLIRRRAVFGWFRRTFRPLPKDPAMLGPDVPVGSVGHRRLELLRNSDYGPVVREYVRRLFQDRGLAGEPTGDKLPAVEFTVRNPQFLRDALRTLWAELGSVAPVGYGRWRQLEPLIAAVRAAADDDRWRFAAPPSRDAS